VCVCVCVCGFFFFFPPEVMQYFCIVNTGIPNMPSLQLKDMQY
jgi:hypothetical protein